MLEMILSTLKTMGWLGIVFGILVLVNTVCGAIYNVANGETFSLKKLLKGIGKSIVFYGCSTATAVAFTILPFVNNMIGDTFGTILIDAEMLKMMSSVAVLGICVAAVIAQGKKALEGITNLSTVKTGKEEITWEVVEEENSTEK